MCRQHEEPGDVHPQLAGLTDVLGGDVGLGGVGGDPHGPDPEVVGLLQLVQGADAGQQQRGQSRVVHDLGRGADPLPVGVAARAVGQARAGQPVAVGDLDGVHSGGIDGRGDRAHLVGVHPVPDGVHAVAQGHVLDVELGNAHCRASTRWSASTSSSAVRSAAEVMMSRLPA
jgi:hypothetical protein